MPSINVGCPKCLDIHSIEVWGDDANRSVDENVECSCGVEFNVTIMITSQPNEEENRNKLATCFQCEQEGLMRVMDVVNDGEDNPSYYVECPNCGYGNWVDEEGGACD